MPNSPFAMSYQHPGPGPAYHNLGKPDSDDRYHFHYLEAGKSAKIVIWVCFGLFALGVAGSIYIARRVVSRRRVFHYLSALALTVTALSYFCLATGLGIRGHHRHHRHAQPPHHHDPNPPIGIPEKDHPTEVWIREVFWMQDASHMITLPMFIVMFAILSGMAPMWGATAAISAFFSCAAVVAADNFPSHRRGFLPRIQFIGWTVIAILFTSFAWSMLFFPGITAARTRCRSTRGLYSLGIVGLIIGWIAYPIVWTLGTGTNILSVNAQTIAQCVIDVGTQLGLIFFILFTHVQDPEDPVWCFPEWFVVHRAIAGLDGRGAYAPIPGVEAANQGDTGDTAA